jgi:hypothetical protein
MFPPNPVGLALGTLITAAQGIAVILAGFSLKVPDDLNEVVEFLQVLELDTVILGLPLECALGQAFAARYYLKVSMPAILCATLCFVFVVNHASLKLIRCLKKDFTSDDLIPKSGHRKKIFDHFEKATAKSVSSIPLSKRMSWYFPMNYLDVKNAAMKMLSALFIITTSTSLAIFRYSVGPSGVETVLAYPDVIRGSDEYHA